MNFFPEQGSVIIAATDGLIDSLGSTGNEFENEKDILKTYLEASGKSSKSEKLAKVMARNADQTAGVDNITLIVLSNKKEVLQTNNKELKQKNHKIMKRIN